MNFRSSHALGILTVLWLTPGTSWAYIDPGAGSLLVQMVIVGAVSVMFALKGGWRRIKSFFTMAGKKSDSSGLENDRS